MSRTKYEKCRMYSLIITLIAAVGVGGVVAPTESAAAASPAVGAADIGETMDIVHMQDGRELHGEVLEERRDLIVFRRIDVSTGIESTLTLFKRDIREIERDVPVEEHVELPQEEEPPQPDQQPREQRETVRGLAEGDPSDESLPALLVVPMIGQMGTDIHPDIYREIIDEIRAMNPDVIVWRMKCGVREDLFAPISEMMNESQREEEGLFELTDDYRELVRLLQDELSEFEQVMWVEDSHGISSLVALAWENLYLAPDARLGGLGRIYGAMEQQFSNADVRAKMLGYWITMAEGFLIRGNRSTEIGEAMIRPDRRLSATWRGREVEWQLNTSGQYIVQNSTDSVAGFDARSAENLLISNGTAETIDDLALLLNMREYRRLEGKPQQAIDDYIEDWRRVLANAERWWENYLENRRWAESGDASRYLPRARSDLQKVIRTLHRYRAVEIRFMMQYGVNIERLEILDEQLGDAIRDNTGGGRRRGPGAPTPGGPGAR